MSLVKNLRKQIEDLEHQMLDIQADCLHPEVALYRYSAGTEKHVRCGLCEKRWRIG